MSSHVLLLAMSLLATNTFKQDYTDTMYEEIYGIQSVLTENDSGNIAVFYKRNNQSNVVEYACDRRNEQDLDCHEQSSKEAMGVNDGTPGEFTVEHLHETARKTINRFERLAIPNAKLLGVKTWFTSDYIWSRLSYKRPETGGQKEYMFLACHFHGDVLGCHKKDGPGPGEPGDF